jgi:hypothetical protein
MSSANKHKTVVELREFNMKSIPNGKKLIFIGGTGSGKSVLVMDYLYHHQHDFPIGTVISPTEELNRTFTPHIPSIFIHNEYSNDIIADVLIRQVDIKAKCANDPKYSKVNPDAFCIMDDCLADQQSWKNDRNIRFIFENGRHTNLTFILTLQYPLGIASHLRANTNYIFLSRTAKYLEQKKLYEHYAGMFASFKEFRDVYIQCTNNYGCMVINNDANQTDRIEDQVFYYRADIKSKPDWNTFKLCKPIYWKDNDKIIKLKSKNFEKNFKYNNNSNSTNNNNKYIIN